jgi:hypothetical protein
MTNAVLGIMWTSEFEESVSTQQKSTGSNHQATSPGRAPIETYTSGHEVRFVIGAYTQSPARHVAALMAALSSLGCIGIGLTPGNDTLEVVLLDHLEQIA